VGDMISSVLVSWDNFFTHHKPGIGLEGGRLYKCLAEAMGAPR
jgi:hypothetical protein